MIFAVVLLVPASLSAQTWEVLNPPTGLLDVDKALDEKLFYMDIVNTGSDTLYLKAFRIENLMASGTTAGGVDTAHITYFCWDLCYGEKGAESIEAIKLAPNDTTNSATSNLLEKQYISFVPNDIDGYSRTIMRIANANDPTDFRDLVFEFSVGGATNSIGKAALNHPSLSAPYPNPAKTDFSVDLKLPTGADSEIRMYTLDGKEVLRQPLASTQTSHRIEVETLPSGMYFLQLLQAGTLLSTRRIVLE